MGGRVAVKIIDCLSVERCGAVMAKASPYERHIVIDGFCRENEGDVDAGFF